MQAYRVLGTTEEVTACDCCGRSGLKSTVALHDEQDGATVYFGVTCAAKAAKWTVKETRSAMTAARRELEELQATVRAANNKAEHAAWCRHIIAKCNAAGAPVSVRYIYDSNLDLYAAIQALGGIEAARDGYVRPTPAPMPVMLPV